MISRCPSNGEFTALLSGQIPEDTLGAIEAHLSTCKICRNQLDQLTTSPLLNDWRVVGEHGSNAFPYLQHSDNTGDLGRIDRYRVQAELGRGGMGVVFRAWDDQLKRAVALKVLRVGQDDHLGAQRFTREAQSAGKLRHDHLVPVLDVISTQDGRPVMVMPLISGQTLRDRLKKGSELSMKEIARIICEVADGLSAIHAAGMIHRDVKPANILLDLMDGRAKLTDFGLSRELEPVETITQTGMIIGTPEYLSPEQVINPNRITVATDIYSLGITFYECLTGVVPFRGNAWEVIALHRTAEPISIRKLNTYVPIDLQTICEKCLAKNPIDRYSSASELRNDIDRWMTGLHILARPASRFNRSIKWCTRNPWPVGMFIIVVFGLIMSISGWMRANWHADRAAEQKQIAINASAISDQRALIAFDAINSLITESQNRIGNTPNTLVLKKQLNEIALNDLRKLGDALEKIPTADLSAIRAHQKLGDTLNLLGQTDNAMTHWHRSIAIAEQCLITQPNDTSIVRELAKAHYALGFVLNRRSEFKKAMTEMEQSIRLLESLQTQDPNNAETLDALARAYAGQADVAWVTLKTRQAMQGYEHAVTLDEQALSLSPADSRILSNLHYCLGRIGYVHLTLLHNYPESEKISRKLLLEANEQLKIHPEDSLWLRNRDIVKLDLSAALRRQCRFTEAESLARDALEPLAKRALEDPDNGMAQRDHASALSHLGHVQMGKGDLKHANQSFQEAAIILESVMTRGNQVSLVTTDLPQIYYCIANASIRLGDYNLTGKAYDKWIEYSLQNLGTNDTPEIRKLVNQRTTDFHKALNLFPAAEKESVSNSLSPEVAINVTILKQYYYIRTEQFAKADRELNEELKKYPSHVWLINARAILDGWIASKTTDAAERERRIESGTQAFLKVIELDRLSLDFAFIMPETNLLRTNPKYLTLLRNKLLVLNLHD